MRREIVPASQERCYTCIHHPSVYLHMHKPVSTFQSFTPYSYLFVPFAVYTFLLPGYVFTSPVFTGLFAIHTATETWWYATEDMMYFFQKIIISFTATADAYVYLIYICWYHRPSSILLSVFTPCFVVYFNLCGWCLYLELCCLFLHLECSCILIEVFIL